MADVIDVLIAEALGEGPQGIAAVAHVINTRARQTGKTPEQVVNEAGQFSGATRPGASVAKSMKDPAVRAQVAKIWEGVQGGQIANPYPGADFFHTPQVNPSWSNSFEKEGQLGNHIFYSSGKSPAPKEAPTPMAPIMRPSQTATAAIERAAPSSTANDWLGYSNQGATRNLPLSDNLTSALSFLPELGVTAKVFSGGQPVAGEGPRVGSTRHDHGDAADVFFYKDGRKLDWANPADLPLFQEIVQRGKSAGITGFGAGDGYMQPGSMHLGFGTPAVWGADGKGSNAPGWLTGAYNGTALKAPQIMRPAQPKQGLFGNIMGGIGNIASFAQGQAAPIMRTAQRTAQNVGNNVMRAANPLGTVAGRTAIIDSGLKKVMTGSYGGSPNTSVVQSYRDQGATPSQAYDAANNAAVERAIANSSNPAQARRLNNRS